MGYTLLKPFKRPWYRKYTFEIRYYLNVTRFALMHLATGLKLILKNETIWYYSYTTNRLLILTGLEYLKYISVDGGETAWLMIDGTFHNCERF